MTIPDLTVQLGEVLNADSFAAMMKTSATF